MPFRSDGGERDRIWAWMQRRWLETMPGIELVVCDDGGQPGERFNEGKAWNRCAELATGDILIVGESEVTFDAANLNAACRQVAENGGWQIASAYHQLNASATEHLLTCDPTSKLMFSAASIDRSFVMSSVSPPLIVSREGWDAVGGMDERYEGWGWIDKAFAAAMNTLYRKYERFSGSVYHLDHGRTEHRDCNPELSHRYLEALGDRDAMYAIIAER